MPVVSFHDALAAVQHLKHKHLLLGNGFSIACRPDIFQYARLFERADFQRLSAGARNAFQLLQTQDFEKIIRVLRNTHVVLGGYDVADESLAERIRNDADGLREVLIQAISASHPARPSDIPAEEYQSCRRFLSAFDRIYTLNYDLLLYWTQMQEPSEVQLAHDDGFRKPENDADAPYVTWEGSSNSQQTTFYLHGGLHIVDTGVEVQKLTWANTGVPLIDQITAALNNNSYPLFVSEGTSQAKLARIRHSDYLSKCYRSLREVQGALFVYGLSMADNDEHILKQIERGKTSHLFVSLYGDPASNANRAVIRRMEQLAEGRPKKKALAVAFFDAESARVWR